MDKLNVLYKKYLDDSISLEELDSFWQLIRQKDINSTFWDDVKDVYVQDFSTKDRLSEQKSKSILENVFSDKQSVGSPLRKKSLLFSYALILITVLLGLRVYLAKQEKSTTSTTSSNSYELLGKGLALLSFPDGKEINIDSLNLYANLQTADIQTSTHDGIVSQIKFSPSERTGNGYFSISTKASRNIATILPDGTKVWLNAGSQLRFPDRFTSTKRELFLSGEGYFEVAKQLDSHHKRIPFIVHVMDKIGNSRGEVRVMGTHFNIKDYPDDNAMVCTLLEGAIQYHNKERTILLRPGQQVIVNDNTVVKDFNSNNEVLAWKNGQILLDGVGVRATFNEISRWYNTKLRFEGNVPDDLSLNGILDKNLPLEDLLKVFNSYGIYCTMHNDTICVRTQQ